MTVDLCSALLTFLRTLLRFNGNVFADELRGAHRKNIIDENFRRSKEKILLVLYLLRNLITATEAQLTVVVLSVFRDTKRTLHSTLASTLNAIATSTERSARPTQAETARAEKMLKDGGREPSLIGDADFVADLETLSCKIVALDFEGTPVA
jgi:hypothetical protein